MPHSRPPREHLFRLVAATLEQRLRPLLALEGALPQGQPDLKLGIVRWGFGFGCGNHIPKLPVYPRPVLLQCLAEGGPAVKPKNSREAPLAELVRGWRLGLAVLQTLE